MSSIALSRTFLQATPDGALDQLGYRYLNATDACFAAYASVPSDDVGGRRLDRRSPVEASPKSSTLES